MVHHCVYVVVDCFFVDRFVRDELFPEMKVKAGQLASTQDVSITTDEATTVAGDSATESPRTS